MPVLRIDEVYPKQSLYPLIVRFQNGYTTEDFKPTPCAWFENTVTGEKSMITEIENVIYAGTEEKGPGSSFLLARNKKTGKVRLIEVGNIELKPVIQNNNNTTVLDTSSLELSRKFGSKKAKKVMEQIEKLKVNKKTVVNQMSNVTVNIKEEQLDLSVYLKTDSNEMYIPPINRQAKEVTDVYEKDKILSKELYEKIISEIENKDYSSELAPWIKQLAAVKRDLKNEDTVLALYASCLVKLYFATCKDLLKKSYIACESSGTLNDFILVNFTTFTNGKRMRSIQLKDKTFCHIIVLILLLNNFKYELDELCLSFKFALRTLNTKIRVTGASIVNGESGKMVQLKLPLSTPGLNRRKSAKF
ncbi:uncharacterized protein LOC131842766 [Achroia grisella]|uniref:uncharacterized protein LOC131842766 n=1 Tax=Achroia grisella TaxID=688607 RepID=UPI0027D21CD8|nr:uncharacterized protein LOC131842766 [Achroia grisella]